MKRILLVDDNPINNSKYTEPLKRSYKLDIVTSVIVARRMIQNENYDLLILDVMMPIGDLECNNELETGFCFYQQVITLISPNMRVLFWSNLQEEAYTNFFNDKRGKNTSFLHKVTGNNAHLVDFVKRIF